MYSSSKLIHIMCLVVLNFACYRIKRDFLDAVICVNIYQPQPKPNPIQDKQGWEVAFDLTLIIF